MKHVFFLVLPFALACSGASLTNVDSDAGDAASGPDAVAKNPDGSTPPGNDAAPPLDAGPQADGATSSIYLACGTTTCTTPPEACCVSAGPTFSCNATCPSSAVALTCESNADCPAKQTCCIENTNTGTRSQCTATCNGGQLCDPNAQTNLCPQGQTCRTDKPQDFNLPTNGTFGVCGG